MVWLPPFAHCSVCAFTIVVEHFSRGHLLQQQIDLFAVCFNVLCQGLFTRTRTGEFSEQF